jgi:putative cell wall-binding protein
VAAVLAATSLAVGGAAPVAAATPSLPVAWERQVPGAAYRESSPALVDVDQNGTLDTVVGGEDGKLWAFDALTGLVLPNWPQTTSNRINSSPSAADVDGDGVPELFVGSGSEGESTGGLYSFALNGHTRFRAAFPDPDFPQGAAVRSGAALGDINGDGVLEATVGVLGVRSLWTVRGTDGGTPSGRELFYWDDTIFGTPALSDVNNDGHPDVVVGGDSSSGPPVDHQGGMVRAIDGRTGNAIWTYRIDDMVRGSVAIGDIDSDGNNEVVFGAGDYFHGADSIRVFAVDATTGALEWYRQTDGVTNASPTLADVNGDGQLDVAFGTWSSPSKGLDGGSVYVLNGKDGSNVNGYPVPSGGGVVLGGISTADLNGDGAQDLFVPTGAFISVFDGKSGAKLYHLGEGDSTGFQNSPTIADVDGDGRLDVIAAGTRVTDKAGMVYRWTLPSGAKLGARGWPTFHKDMRRTGSWTSSVPDAAALPHTRLSGDDRFATAVSVSAGTLNGGTVYVATAEGFADALAGGPAAATTGSPVLLVRRDAVPTATSARLAALRPSNIVVLGGPAAVSDTVVAQLNLLATGGAVRVSGTTRDATSAAISARAFKPGVPVAYVANGGGYADALAGAAAGAYRQGPVLLVGRDSVSSEVSAELRRLSSQSIVVLGGAGVVSDGVLGQMRSYSSQVTRAGGGDRYATAVEVSRLTFPAGAGTAFLATGRDYPDALSGGPAAARAAAPLLLVPGGCVPASVRAEMIRLGTNRLTLLGGSSVVAGGVAALQPCS